MRQKYRPRGGAGIVTTLRDAGAGLDSSIAYHLGIGFEHIFLVFDDPADPDIARVAGNNRVTAIPSNSALEAAWKLLPEYKDHAPFLEHEVMSRQILNAAHVMGLARQQRLDWLLHIDIDELFYSPGETAAQHFERLRSFRADTVRYMNYEAVPEREDIADPFREVTLFKPPVDRVKARHPAAAYAALVADMPQMPAKLFHSYSKGKSAVRLASRAMQPTGVYEFGRWDTPAEAAVTQHHFILHYPNCGFEAFWRKYRRLGAFSDAWWGEYDIAAEIGRLHLDARDIVGTGDRDLALDFYRKRVMVADTAKASRLISLGLAERITDPADRLAKSRRPGR